MDDRFHCPRRAIRVGKGISMEASVRHSCILFDQGEVLVEIVTGSEAA